MDVVVVIPHWGTQYTHRPERSQRTAAAAFTPRLVRAERDPHRRLVHQPRPLRGTVMVRVQDATTRGQGRAHLSITISTS